MSISAIFQIILVFLSIVSLTIGFFFEDISNVISLGETQQIVFLIFGFATFAVYLLVDVFKRC